MLKSLYEAAKNQIGLTLDESYLEKIDEFTGYLEGGKVKHFQVLKNFYDLKFLKDDYRSLTVNIISYNITSYNIILYHII